MNITQDEDDSPEALALEQDRRQVYLLLERLAVCARTAGGQRTIMRSLDNWHAESEATVLDTTSLAEPLLKVARRVCGSFASEAAVTAAVHLLCERLQATPRDQLSRLDEMGRELLTPKLRGGLDAVGLVRDQ